MIAQNDQRWMTISNVLSVLRILVTPVIVYTLLMHFWHVSFWLFIAASCTDLLDGYFARVFHEQTVLGQYLDPLADKILLVSCFCTFAYVQLGMIPLPVWFIALVLFREAIIICGGIVLVVQRQGHTTAPTFLGKVTTASYMVLILWMFLCHFAGWAPSKSFYSGVVVCALFAALSLVQYCVRGVNSLGFRR
jgi:cardiolipin synthase